MVPDGPMDSLKTIYIPQTSLGDNKILKCMVGVNFVIATGIEY